MAALNVGIAGAGLLGRLLALQLSGQGHRVTVFDPACDPQARGAAGWTAAGMLSPLAEFECGDGAWPKSFMCCARGSRRKRLGRHLLGDGCARRQHLRILVVSESGSQSTLRSLPLRTRTLDRRARPLTAMHMGLPTRSSSAAGS